MKPGRVGLRCRFCLGKNKQSGSRVFPAAAASLEQLDVGNRIKSHLTKDCVKCPAAVKQAFVDLEEREQDERRRYGSRKNFFQRLWSRMYNLKHVNSNNMHRTGGCKTNKVSSSDDNTNVGVDSSLQYLREVDEEEEDDSDNDGLSDTEIDIEALVSGSPVLSMADRGMVSDAHLVAFAQLRPCRVQQEDQCGWYKDREIGFPGLCCRHCGGRPSSGRYFPKPGDFYLRSSKQSIIRHILENCGSCPPDVRASLTRLTKRDKARSSWKIVDDSILGAGKLFHDSLGRRLYALLGVEYAVAPESVGDAHSQDGSSSSSSVGSPSDNKKRKTSTGEGTEDYNSYGNHSNGNLLDSIRHKRTKIMREAVQRPSL